MLVIRRLRVLKMLQCQIERCYGVAYQQDSGYSSSNDYVLIAVDTSKKETLRVFFYVISLKGQCDIVFLKETKSLNL